MNTDFYKKEPIFILGNPRSGTSLLRLMIDTHDNVCIPPESHFFLWLEGKYGEWNPSLLEAYLQDLFLATKFETWKLDVNKLKSFLEGYEIDSYATLTSLVYHFYGKEKGSNAMFWGDKNSLWVDKLNVIKKHYPNAIYLHIIRDGRDVSCSYKELNNQKITSKYAPKLPNTISEIAEKWSNNVEYVSEFLSSEINKKKYTEIYYEDLINSPQKVLQNVMKIFGLKLMNKQLEYYNKPKESIEPEAFFAWKEKLVQPLDSKNIGKYKDQLSLEEINSFNEIAKKTLTKHGYL